MDRPSVDTASTVDGMPESRGCYAGNGYTYLGFLDSSAHMTTAERLMVRVLAKGPQRVMRLIATRVQNSTVRVAGIAQALAP